jgi:YD repeat-containing protein
VGNPILPLTGVKREAVDTGVSLGGLKLVLTYDSTGSSPATIAGASTSVREPAAFGALWKSSFHRKLLLQDGSRKALVNRGNGYVEYFNGDGSGVFTAPVGNPNTLTVSGGAYILTDVRSREVEVYDSSGRLVRMTTSDHHSLEFGYSGDRLTTVRLGGHRGIAFAYTNNRVSKVVAADGRAIDAAYDGAGNLVSLTWPDSKKLQFLYENVSFPWALTGKIDENNSRLATYSYDQEGRAVSTELSSGVNKYTVSYASPPRRMVSESVDTTRNVLMRGFSWLLPEGATVIHPNADASAWSASTAGGVPVLAARTQPAGSGAASAATQSTYDAAGNLTSRDDASGNRTCFGYGAGGRETVRVEGLTTAAACPGVIAPGATLPAGSRKTTTTWHPDWLLRAEEVRDAKKTTWVYHGRPDPYGANAAASCTSAAALPNGKVLPVLCKRVEEALLSNGNPDPSVLLRTTRYTYDASGRMTSSVDPRNQTTTFTYFSDVSWNGGAQRDLDYDKVLLLLRGNGAHGSTSIGDESPHQRTITRWGNAQVSNAESKFGGGSLAFDGSGDYLTIPSSPDFDLGSDDFTIEMWVKSTQSTTYSTLITREWGSSFAGAYTIHLNGNNSGPLEAVAADHSISGPLVASSNTSTRNGSWHHIAWTRKGNVHRLFDNGVQVGTATAGASISSASKSITIGNDVTFGGGARAYNGYIDDLRMTKGVARYTANFTPPSAELPNSSYLPTDLGHMPGDLQSITNAAGHVTTFDAYDPTGRVRQMTDAKGVVTSIGYTPRGWIASVAVTAPGGSVRTTTYTHDGAGLLTQVSQADGTALSYSYDAAHRLVGVTDTRGNAVTYTLDNAGNRIGEELRDPSGTLLRAIARSFDALNRLQQAVGAPR